MNTVAVIDYGMGNLHSVSKAIEHVAPEANVLVTSDASLIREADRVVLPGVGAIRDCMAEIKRLKVDELVREVSRDRPFLGICVGMQALMQTSEENNGVDCIGLLPGQVKYFGDPLVEDGVKLKVPHMGWNRVSQTHAHPLWKGIDNDERFYFVHSYYVAMEQTEYVMGRSHYGNSIDAAVGHDNIFAVQFHPEKSGVEGSKILENFLNL